MGFPEFSLHQPTGNASAPYWTQVDLSLAQAFIDDQLSGFGLMGIWDAENIPEPKGDTPQEWTEVWFDKVKVFSALH